MPESAPVASLVSVILSTYNRYPELMQALDSVRRQTYQNLEIIVVDDDSSDPRYAAPPPADVVWIGLRPSSRERFGYPCLGYVRNRGLERARGEYVAFLDDDDFWFPDKIRLQKEAMDSGGFGFCCTEGLMGDGLYDPGRNYPVYHREFYRKVCADFFAGQGAAWTGRLPDVFSRDLIEKRNFVIHSSVLVRRDLLDRAGSYRELPLGGVKEGEKLLVEDWDLWKRCAVLGDFRHLNTPLVYYDGRLSERKFGRRLLRRLRKIFSSGQKKMAQHL